MRTKLLFLLLLFNYILSSAQTTKIPDSKFEQALIDLGYDVGPVDGAVFTANIQEIEILDVNDRNINDLTGVEGFASVLFINANANNLTQIDVSKNLNLQTLGLNSNNISTLDISANANLVQLEINDNLLTAIDVSNNNSLTTLLLSNNPLAESPNLDNLSDLEFLFLTNVGLTSLDLSNNPSLEFIRIAQNPNLTCVKVGDVDAIEAATNQKDTQTEYSLDCSSQNSGAITQITDPNFEQALIDLGYDSGSIDGSIPTPNIDVVVQLELLDKNISNLNGIEDFQALESLYIARSPINEINLTQNLSLKDITISEGNLTDIDLTNNVNLTSVWLEFMPNLTSIDLSQNVNLEGLDLNNTGLGSIDLSNNPNIQFLFLHDTNLESLDVSDIPDLVFFFAENNPNLNCIEINDLNAIGNPDNWKKDETSSYSEDCSSTTTDTDSDNDGVSDVDDICPNTPQGTVVTTNGCAISQLADLAVLNIGLGIGSNPCTDVPSGNVNIEVLKNVDLNVTILKDNSETAFDGQVGHTNPLLMSDLVGGNYEICVSLSSFPAFSQCFEVTYSSSENSARTTIVMQNAGQVFPMTVNGNERYDVSVNGTITEFEFDSTDEQQINIPLEVGSNTIIVTGILDCGEGNNNPSGKQQALTDLITYPNPTVDRFSLDGLGSEEKIQVVIQNAVGIKVYQEMVPVVEGKVIVDISTFSTGVYYIGATTLKVTKTSKILKQ